VTRYTSLEVSDQLAEAGFKEQSEYVICRGYRSDTLLMWLLERGWDVTIGRPHDKVLVDAASMKENKRFAAKAETLPDALAEVVKTVMGAK
jgi:hypothetical protein